MATADKFVNNRLVNVLGCQPVRTLVAAALVRWRRLHVPGVADIGHRLRRVTLHKYPERFPLVHSALLQNEGLLALIRFYEGWGATERFDDRGTVLKFEPQTSSLLMPNMDVR